MNSAPHGALQVYTMGRTFGFLAVWTFTALLVVFAALSASAEWLAPVQLGSGAGSTFCLDIEFTSDLRVHAIFYRTSDEKLYERVWDGSAWGPDVPITRHNAKEPGAATIVDRFEPHKMHMVSLARGLVGTDYAIFYRSYDGADWSGPVPLTDGTSYSADPHIDQDDQGNLHVVWTGDGRGGDGDIFCRRRLGQDWQPTQNLTNNYAGTSYGSVSPDIACADTGPNVAVAWHDDFANDGFQAYVAESTGRGAAGTWSAWQQVSSGSYGKAPLVGYHGTDTIHVTWIHRTGSGANQIAHRTRTGGVWTPMQIIVSNGDANWELDPAGHLRLVYPLEVSGEADIFYSRWDGVTFHDTFNVSSDPSKSSHQAVAFDHASGWVFVGYTSITTWPDRHLWARFHRGSPIPTPTANLTPSLTPTASLTPTRTLTPTPSHTGTVTPTPTLTNTPRTRTPSPVGGHSLILW